MILTGTLHEITWEKHQQTLIEKGGIFEGSPYHSLEDITEAHRDNLKIVYEDFEGSYIESVNARYRGDFKVLGVYYGEQLTDDIAGAWREYYCIIEVGLPNHYYVLKEIFEIEYDGEFGYERRIEDEGSKVIVPKSHYMDWVMGENGGYYHA